MAKTSAKLGEISYKLLAPVGSGRTTKQGSILSLLSDIPYFFVAKIIPPLSAVNDVLQKGVIDAGMSGGCRWKPLKLTPEQYGELVREMKRKRFRKIEPPNWVLSHNDWHHWCCELVWGIPAVEAKQFSDETAKLERQRHKAIKDSDEKKAATLLHLLVDLCMEHSKFVNSHRSNKPKLPTFRR